MFEAFARYVMLLSDRPTDGTPIDSLMRRASSSRRMMDYFAMLADGVLHDPNSPLRNDEFYIPVLRALLAAPWYDEYERIAPEYDLRMALQNRVGHPANDFRYTLASGAQGTLYGLDAEYVLLFVNNPGCPMCREIREEIAASPMLSEMIERGRLCVLTLYPDEDLAAWRDYAEQIPQSGSTPTTAAVSSAKRAPTISTPFRRFTCSTATSACWSRTRCRSRRSRR